MSSIFTELNWHNLVCIYIMYVLTIIHVFQIPYIETSAKDPPLNVDLAFHQVVRVIR